MSRLCERTASHDRVLERKTPTEEVGVGQSGNHTHDTLTGKIAPGEQLSEVTFVPAVICARESDTRNCGCEGGQDRDESDDLHNVWVSGKGRVRVTRNSGSGGQ